MLPARKASSVAVRWCWSMSPWSAPALKPCRNSEACRIATSRLRLQKMMAFRTPVPRMSWRRTARLALGSTGDLTKRCTMVRAVVAGGATSTRSGDFRKRATRRWISPGIVAEKNNVCRIGGSSEHMRSMSGMKPMSSIRSASSMTRISMPVSSSLPRWKWSRSRPGVAMTTSAPRSSFLSWSSKETPPISNATVSLWSLPSVLKWSATWAASSRVGAKISERGMRALALPRSSRVNIGSTNDAVLPVPVCAMPRTSRPPTAIGIAAACIGVGLVKPAAFTASMTFWLKPSCEKPLSKR